MHLLGANIHGKSTRMREQQGPRDGQQGIHFSNYDLIRRIDVGGMGEVYLARQRTAFGRKVAVKIIRSDLVHDTTARKRFLREAEVSAHLKHEHILTLVEFGEEQGRLFIVTPYIEGGTLVQRLQSGSLPLAEIHDLFSALVRAIAYIHKRGVIHRDLKPSNVLLDKEEDSEQVYVRLIDFGIASLQGSSAQPQMTIGGNEMATLAYMAPERLDGIAAPSNDIYSLGIILYQMVTGKLPGDGSPGPLPPAMEHVIRRCVALNPADRFSSADELLKAFEYACRYLSSVQSVHDPINAQPARPEQVAQEAEQPTPRRVAAPRPSLPPLSEQRAQLPKTNPESAPPVQQPAPARSNNAAVERKQQTGAQPVLSRATTEHRQQTGAQRSLKATESQRQTTGAQQAIARSQTPPQQTGKQRSVAVAPAQAKLASTNVVDTPAASQFSPEDYSAPTSYLSAGALPRQNGKKKQPTADANIPSATPGKRTRGNTPRSVLAIIPAAILILVLLIAGMGYLAFQASISATISVSPQAQTLSKVFTLKAKPGVKNIDFNAGVIPAAALTSTKSGSKQGPTTGKSSCVFIIFQCKQSVSVTDITTLVAQLQPDLRAQIDQDLKKQEQVNNGIPVGPTYYSDVSINSDPQVGAVSKTVTVSLTEQGSVEYFKASDAQNVATQLLKMQMAKQFGSQYTALDQLTQIGQPVVQGVDADGVVTLAIAAGGVAQYNITPAQIKDMQNHIKGLKLQAARAYIQKQQGIDPSSVGVKLSFGDTIPTNLDAIKINTLNAANLPPVQLPAIKPSATATKRT